jgi:CheY-like chemotaxis protein/HPt (histidine-containing phosphotransfer) domain-containing protein
MRDVNILTSNGVNVAKSLELFGDMETYDQTLEDFLSAVEEKINNLNKYKEETDMPSYAIDVHGLKSDARYLGFEALGELAYDLELKSKANEVLYILDNHEKLIDEAKKCLNIARQYLGKEVTVSTPEIVVIKDEAILVVDDSNLVANFIKKIFDDRFEVYIASDGAKAIEMIEQDTTGKIKGCLLDLNMPNVNGFEVLEYFQKNNLFVKIPVSIITGNDTKDSVENAFVYPIVDLLSKPFNERDIKRIIEKTINFNK